MQTRRARASSLLAVHVNGPRHQLMLFWAPFVLVHLGGKENLTTLSMEGNDLWKRHLLKLKFLCGFLKYATAFMQPDQQASGLNPSVVCLSCYGCFNKLSEEI
ncbi:hypothetical protein E2562_012039 [Oryza meyeriana var. granulata]|uniref:DUF4220 domain-containing protein n=1 Tax=Oryza meyeriana var. granulata TaxID=110450 RepID=A0A6G1D2G1_9ORYZ|nr:hypothetical protein E2562_012039 [Oryza meyeriana var. granulata]